MSEGNSVSVHDVAAYILAHTGVITTMKLQKLVYYCQAWSLVWDEEPLFPETIEAWANGPVVPSLYAAHRGMYKVSSWTYGEAEKLSPTQRETVDGVLDFYGDKPSHWLSNLTHKESPWRDARGCMPDGVRGSNEITPASMFEYYDGLGN